MAQLCKLENVKKESDRLGVDIMGSSEMRRKRAGKIKSNKHTVLYSGNEKAFENGVGIINEKIEKSLKGYWPISDRVIAAKFQWTPFDLFVIQIYAPTTASEDEKVHEFYGEINCALKQCKSRDMLIVMRDFNAEVGKGASGTAIGPFGLGGMKEGIYLRNGVKPIN